MTRRLTRRGPPAPIETTPNLAPMVDVIMVILVFFMLGASLAVTREGLLPTELDPRSGPGGGAEIEVIPTVQIGIRQTAPDRFVVSVMGAPLSGADPLEALGDLLSQRLAAGADPLSPVVIGADGGAPWRVVVGVMDRVLLSGFRNVQFTVSLTARDVSP